MNNISMNGQNEGLLPDIIMKKAAKGISYIAHPMRLRILEYLDVNGESSVSTISKGIKEDQMIVSQNLKKLRDANLLKTKRKGTFIYYSIDEEYPASLFVCIRILYASMTGNEEFMTEGYKGILPVDFTTLAANRIKLFSHIDKLKILEYLTINGENCVSNISNGINTGQLKTTQYLNKLKDDDFVKSRREGRFIYYSITKGIHKTAIQCIHKRYNSLKNKEDF